MKAVAALSAARERYRLRHALATWHRGALRGLLRRRTAALPHLQSRVTALEAELERLRGIVQEQVELQVCDRYPRGRHPSLTHGDAGNPAGGGHVEVSMPRRETPLIDEALGCKDVSHR